jgi:hypothetical protein
MKKSRTVAPSAKRLRAAKASPQTGKRKSCGGRPISHPDYSDEWATPAHVVRALGVFDLDPCAGDSNHAAHNIRLPRCGLHERWRGRVWLNPPFSNRAPWIGKMIVHGNGILLIPANLKSRAFHLAAAHCDACILVGPRDIHYEYKMGKRESTLPHGTALFAFGARNVAALLACGIPGQIMSTLEFGRGE